MSIAYRPSHADATYDMKYGIRAVEVIPLVSYLYIILILVERFVTLCMSFVCFHVGWWQIFSQGNHWEGCCWSCC